MPELFSLFWKQAWLTFAHSSPYLGWCSLPKATQLLSPHFLLWAPAQWLPLVRPSPDQPTECRKISLHVPSLLPVIHFSMALIIIWVIVSLFSVCLCYKINHRKAGILYVLLLVTTSALRTMLDTGHALNTYLLHEWKTGSMNKWYCHLWTCPISFTKI